MTFTSSFVISQVGQLQEVVEEVVAEDTQSQTADGPIMTFESKTVDYGTIEQNGDPLKVLTFSNTGTEPLVIKNARGSCGCTVPTWPKEPIMPGEEAEIEVRYATNRLGSINKTIKVTTNEGGDPHVLKVIGKVLKPEATESVPTGEPTMLKGGK